MSPLRLYIRNLLLEGAKERYLRMFQVPNASNKFMEKVEFHIDWARRVLKKDNAIVWYLRWFKTWVLDIELDDGSYVGGEILIKTIEQMKTKTGIRSSYEIEQNAMDVISYRGRTDFEHFMSLDIPAINNYDWGWKTPAKVLNDFRIIENEWKKKYDGLIPQKEDDQIIMQFEDGFAWLFLPRSECSEESKAMGHCGNAAGRTTDRILSLRSKTKGHDGKPYWNVHLTFILEEDRYLGEMKGRGNDKPSSKYHKYIEALLTAENLTAVDNQYDWSKSPVSPEINKIKRDITIAGIRGGGYMPKNNFSILDLGKEKAKELVSQIPTLAPIDVQYELFGATKEIVEQIKSGLKRIFGNKWKIKWNEKNDTFVLREYNGFIDMLEYHDMGGHAIHALLDYLSTGTITDNDWGYVDTHGAQFKRIVNDVVALPGLNRRIRQYVNNANNPTSSKHFENGDYYQALVSVDPKAYLSKEGNPVLKAIEKAVEQEDKRLLGDALIKDLSQTLSESNFYYFDNTTEYPVNREQALKVKKIEVLVSFLTAFDWVKRWQNNDEEELYNHPADYLVDFDRWDESVTDQFNWGYDWDTDKIHRSAFINVSTVLSEMGI